MTRAVSGRRGAVDFRRAEQIVVIDHLRPGGLLQRDNIAQRHQAVGVGAHVVLPQVARVHAERLIGLHVNAIRAIVEVEIVHILRAHVDAEGLRDLADRHSDGFRLLAIDLHQLLRIVGGEAGEQACEDPGAGGCRRRSCAQRCRCPAGCCGPGPAVRTGIRRSCRCLDRGRLERDHDRSGNAQTAWARRAPQYRWPRALCLCGRQIGFSGANTRP